MERRVDAVGAVFVVFCGLRVEVSAAEKVEFEKIVETFMYLLATRPGSGGMGCNENSGSLDAGRAHLLKRRAANVKGSQPSEAAGEAKLAMQNFNELAGAGRWIVNDGRRHEQVFATRSKYRSCSCRTEPSFVDGMTTLLSDS